MFKQPLTPIDVLHVCSLDLLLCMFVFLSCYSCCTIWSNFFFHDTATTEIYTYLHTLFLHDALPFCCGTVPASSRAAASPPTACCRGGWHSRRARRPPRPFPRRCVRLPRAPRGGAVKAATLCPCTTAGRAARARRASPCPRPAARRRRDRKSTRLNSTP